MARTFLIDYENTAEHGFDDIRLEKHDVLYCFFTKNTPKISLEVLSKFQQGTMRFVSAPSGKDSLDAVLCSYIGYLIARSQANGMDDPDRRYIILSKDTIYDSPIKFWNEAYGKTVVTRQCPKALSNDPPRFKPVQSEQAFMAEARKFVTEYRGPMNVKMALYQRMVKQYGQTKGLERYNTAKAVLW